MGALFQKPHNPQPFGISQHYPLKNVQHTTIRSVLPLADTTAKEPGHVFIHPGDPDYESAWNFLDSAGLRREFERETAAHAECQSCDFNVSIAFPLGDIPYDMKIPLQGAFAGRTLFLPKGTKWELAKRLTFIRHTIPWPRYTLTFLLQCIVASRVLYDVAGGKENVV